MMWLFRWAALAAIGAVSCRGQAVAPDPRGEGDRGSEIPAAGQDYGTTFMTPAPVIGPNPMAVAGFEILHSGLWVQLEPNGTDEMLIRAACPQCEAIVLGRACIPDERFVNIRTARDQVSVACDAFAAFAWTGESSPFDVLQAFASLPSNGSAVTPVRESEDVAGARRFDVTAENIRIAAYARYANDGDCGSGFVALGRWRTDANATLNASDVTQMVRDARRAAE